MSLVILVVDSQLYSTMLSIFRVKNLETVAYIYDFLKGEIDFQN